MSDLTQIPDFYAVRNKDGLWFRAKGYDGDGDTWVGDIKKARIYNRIGPARATVSYFAKNHPKYGIPDLVKFVVTGVEVVHSEVERVQKLQAKRAKAQKEAEIREQQRDLEDAQRKLELAQKRLAKLRGQ